MLVSRLLSPTVMPWMVIGVIGVIAVLRVDRADIPEVLRRLFPWRRR